MRVHLRGSAAKDFFLAFAKTIGQVASLVDRRRTFCFEDAGQRNRSFLSEHILDPYPRGDLSSHELDSRIDMICI